MPPPFKPPPRSKSIISNPPTKPQPSKDEAGEEEEEDYMTMLLPDAPSSSSLLGSEAPRCETSLQRRLRLKREAEARARPKSKAELEAEAEQRREEALRTSLFERMPRSKGLKMMEKMGFVGGSLGRRKESEDGGGGGGDGNAAASSSGEKTSAAPDSDTNENTTTAAPKAAAQQQQKKPTTTIPEPIRLHIRPENDRSGIGLESERKRQLHEAFDSISSSDEAKRLRKEDVDPAAYRARIAREREEARLTRQFEAAQRVAERMAREREEEEVAGEGGRGVVRGEAKLLRSIPVEYRGLVRAREESERDAKMRRDLEYGLARPSSLISPAEEEEEEEEDEEQNPSSRPRLHKPKTKTRLPDYNSGSDSDSDDRMALGRDIDDNDRPKKSSYVAALAEDLDEEDPELDDFNALPVEERLRRVLEYLRKEYRYCFWCKYRYPDEGMEGCPGLTEEEHE
ncbi:hypothetical protein VTJ04DRAFT_2916 [Mycothermus thermophilus]|uniref:uncharacterized protein n=1 Tax=Humicola insolens TaxID=85995 RepID=UPI00374491B1